MGHRFKLEAAISKYSLPQPEADKNLRHAALHGDIDQVILALENGAYVDCEDQYGNTPLLFAAARGRVPVIRHLLRVGANIDAQGRDGGTPLHSAARWGKAKAVEELLRRGADAMATDSAGRMARDVVRALVAADADRCKAGVHPPEVQASEPSEISLNDGSLDEQEEKEERRRAAADRAREVEKWARGLSPHEQCLAVLEDWIKAAEEAMEAEDTIDVVVVEEEDDDMVAEELRIRIRELTLTMGHKETEVEVSSKQEQNTMTTVRELTKQITEYETKLNLLSTEMETCQGVVVSARTARLLSTYDIAKIRLERLEKEIEVARLEGRPEVKEELEVLLPSLKEQKKKAQHACRHLLRDRKRMAHHHHESFRLDQPMTPPPPDEPGSPNSRSLTRMQSKLLSSRTVEPDPPYEDYTAFEMPDRFGGKVPMRLNLNDDTWRAVDALQTTIDRLRRQVRFLGGKPHC
jgi:hypothetical protein